MYIMNNSEKLRKLFAEKESFPQIITVKIIQHLVVEEYCPSSLDKIHKCVYKIYIWKNFYYVNKINEKTYVYDWKIILKLYKNEGNSISKGFYFIYDKIFGNYLNTKLPLDDQFILYKKGFSSLKNLKSLSNNKLIGYRMNILMKKHKNPFYILDLYKKDLLCGFYAERQLKNLYYFLLSYFLRPNSLYVTNILKKRFDKTRLN